MSNLLKALKRAQRDREAVRQTNAAAHSPAAPPVSPAATSETVAIRDDSEVALPAVMRLQRDAVKASERLAPHASAVVVTASPYRGVGISLSLAVLFAVGFGLWVRGRDVGRPPVRDAALTKATAPLRSTIPAALRVSEAGTLQLRLDRRVDAIGQLAHRRAKAQ